jgi:hypothetical protein
LPTVYVLFYKMDDCVLLFQTLGRICAIERGCSVSLRSKRNTHTLKPKQGFYGARARYSVKKERNLGVKRR